MQQAPARQGQVQDFLTHYDHQSNLVKSPWKVHFVLLQENQKVPMFQAETVAICYLENGQNGKKKGYKDQFPLNCY